MRVAVTLGVCLLGVAGQAQVRAPDHNAGILVPGDFDGDGLADVLVLPPNHSPRLYLGTAQHPFLRRGPALQMGAALHPDAPVFAGGHLYVPSINWTIGKGYVDVVKVDATNGNVQRVVTHQLDQSPGAGFVNSVKLTRLDCDIDNDGGGDIVAVWGEEPAAPAAAAHSAYLSPSRMTASTAIPPLPGQPSRSSVVDVHPAFNGFTRQSQFLAVLSGDPANRWDGLGLQWLGIAADRSAPTAVGGRWYRGAPTVPYAGRVATRAPSSFGAFTTAAALGTPIVKTAAGPSVLFQPWVTAPYVDPNRARFLSTTTTGFALGDCTADYDGDGRMEAVFCETNRTTAPDFVVIACPAPDRPYIQAFDLSILVKQPGIRPQHGATADFDGDGDLDVLLACEAMGVPGSTFVMLRNARSASTRGRGTLYMVR